MSPGSGAPAGIVTSNPAQPLAPVKPRGRRIRGWARQRVTDGKGPIPGKVVEPAVSEAARNAIAPVGPQELMEIVSPADTGPSGVTVNVPDPPEHCAGAE